MKNRFQFYEVVVVTSPTGTLPESMIGEEGTILGMAQYEDSLRWTYSVFMDSIGECLGFDEQHLESTGKHRKRSDFYTGESVRVQVDPETGRGSIKH